MARPPDGKASGQLGARVDNWTRMLDPPRGVLQRTAIQAFQAECRGIETRLPLQSLLEHDRIRSGEPVVNGAADEFGRKVHYGRRVPKKTCQASSDLATRLNSM
jgi:hypothetical protein